MSVDEGFDLEADVVVVGAGGAGLPAVVAAAEGGASVVCVEANHDVGGHAMLSGGRVSLGGGTSLQRKHGIVDSADRIYEDFLDHREPGLLFSLGLLLADRSLVRAWADANAETLEFLIRGGVEFDDCAPTTSPGYLPGSTPRLSIASSPSDDFGTTINGLRGAGVVRPLHARALSLGVTFLLSHRLTRILRSGEVYGIEATATDGVTCRIRARNGVVIATGGHTSNVELRRTFDPRLTEEYQTAGEPWSMQTGDGEVAAMAIGGVMWGATSQYQPGLSITKTRHIGCRYGYTNLKWDPRSPVFARAGASGLTVGDFQNLIMVNRRGERFWDETDESGEFLESCLSSHGDLSGGNGGGPIWAVFDSASVEREGWDVRPPNVDPDGWFFSAPSIPQLAEAITNRYQREPISPQTLSATVERWNGMVRSGADTDFGSPARHEIARPPFYAAWATPILHDSLAGLRTDGRCRSIDVNGEVIPGLYCAGESAGGFGHHGLSRAIVFGYIAGREAAARRPD